MEKQGDWDKVEVKEGRSATIYWIESSKGELVNYFL